MCGSGGTEADLGLQIQDKGKKERKGSQTGERVDVSDWGGWQGRDF